MSARREVAALVVTGDDISPNGSDWHHVAERRACTVIGHDPLCSVLLVVVSGEWKSGLHLPLGAEVWVRRQVGP